MQKTQGECVYLDMTGLDAALVKKRFPRIYSTCLSYNIDITTDLVPIRPAAHYAMGGVATDLHGATTLGGLYAAGEVASTGVHGANRLASNSLLEGLVFGARAAAAMIEKRQEFKPPSPCKVRNTHLRDAVPPRASNTGEAEPVQVSTQECVDAVRSLLWHNVGIIRNGKETCKALLRLNSLHLDGQDDPSSQFHEARNILEVGRIITQCALARQESRGAHYRSDFPLKDQASPARHSFAARDAQVFFA